MQADTNAGFDPEATVREECGRVITNPNQAEHLGATRATNNTGELSAVCHALTGARELVQPGEEVLVLFDSQIAICTTTGAWASRKNKALAGRSQQESPGGPAGRWHDGAVSAHCFERTPATE